MPGTAGLGVTRRTAPRRRVGARLAVAAGIVALLSALLPTPSLVAADVAPPPVTTQVQSPNPAATDDTVGATPTPLASPSVSTAPSPSDTADPTPSDSPVPSPSDTAGPTPSDSPVPSPSDSPVPSPSNAAAPTPTDSPAPTSTPVATPTLAPDPAVAYIVAFAAGTSAADQSASIAAAGATDVQAIAPLRMHAITLPSSIAAHGVALLLADPSVLRVDSDAVREAGATPSDTAYPSQWALPQIGWDKVFGVVKPSGSAIVAILDTGDRRLPARPGRPARGRHQHPRRLGRHQRSQRPRHRMAGIIAAATDNGTGIAGVGYCGRQGHAGHRPGRRRTSARTPTSSPASSGRSTMAPTSST